MDLDMLAVFDRVTVNLEKLEKVWQRAHALLSAGTNQSSVREYTALAQDWEALLGGLPPIKGWRISNGLPDVTEISRAFRNYSELSSFPETAKAEMERPDQDLATYRRLLDRARHQETASRLSELTDKTTHLINVIVGRIPSSDQDDLSSARRRERIEMPEVEQVESCIDEIEALLGSSAERSGRWSELRRHLRFSEAHDWVEISDIDWPSVLPDIEAVRLGDTDPIPVPDVDLATYQRNVGDGSGPLGEITGGRLGTASISPAVSRQGGLHAKENLVSAAGRDAIFIVHGHDDAAKTEIAYFLHRLTGKEPVILHEQRNMGKSLIEKLEHAASLTGFAVVLLTPDDLGRAKASSELEPRGRQNVVFEMGYFMALLGRDRVAVLHTQNVQAPGDTHGMLYIPYGPFDNWQGKLAGELSASGFNINAEILMK